MNEIEELKRRYEENKNKIKSLTTREKSLKVLANSLYGASGQESFIFFQIALAEAVTTTGKLSILSVINELDNLFESQIVVASDTDSVYVALQNKIENPTVEKIDEFSKNTLTPLINSKCKELSDKMNWTENRLNFKRESICSSMIITGKKHYCMNLLDMEGVRYSEPKIKIVGIEAVKSSTPAWCRDKIKHAIKLMLTDNEENFQLYIEKCHKDWQTLSIEEISFPKGVNGLEDYTINTLGCPIHVRAALIHNKYKPSNIAPITSGNKIKFIYLKEPNEYNSHVIAFVENCPFNNLPIDREIQWQKAFLKIITGITEKIKWNHERVSWHF